MEALHALLRARDFAAVEAAFAPVAAPNLNVGLAQSDGTVRALRGG
jgi:hypothetical protein